MSRLAGARSPAGSRLVRPREDGLGDKFLSSVEQTLERISINPEQHAIAVLDLRRAPIGPFGYSLFYRVLPDESIIVVALSGAARRVVVRRPAIRSVEPS